MIPLINLTIKLIKTDSINKCGCGLTYKNNYHCTTKIININFEHKN